VAIGAAEGGHDAIHPDLGTEADFRHFVRAAAQAGLEVAMDLALQCAPDHPWVTEHPEWFTTRADGQIAYAENPPKKYQDIYPVNFDNDPAGIRAEVLRVVAALGTPGHQDLPGGQPAHKPMDFWYWLIWRVKGGGPGRAVPGRGVHPAGADARPRQIGFSSPTPTSPGGPLRGDARILPGAGRLGDYMRPNFWPNTPDILPEALQYGGPPCSRSVRYWPACSPVLGHVRRLRALRAPGRPGADEYLDNEKYQRAPGLAAAEAAGDHWRLHRPAQPDPAGQPGPCTGCATCGFHHIDNPALLCWSKRDPSRATRC